jgi:hypothetical protein
LVPKALQHLGQDQIADDQDATPQEKRQKVGFSRVATVEKIDPD